MRMRGYSDKPACASTQNAGTFYIQFHDMRCTDTLIITNLLNLKQFKANN